MTCPDPETIAQWLEGRLPEFGREALLEHLGTCDACREMAVLLAPEKRATERRNPLRRKGFAWGGWVAAAAVVAAALVVWKQLPAKKPASPGGTGEITRAAAPQAVPDKPVAPAPSPGDPKPQPPVDPVPKPPADPVPLPPVDPGPQPPVDPGPKPPVDPAPEPPVNPVPPTRALAALRVLDIQGRLVCGTADLREGAATAGDLTAPDGGGFHLDGHAVALARGTSVAFSRDGDRVVFEVRNGEVFVDPRGAFAIRAAGKEVTLESAAIVTSAGAGPCRDKAAADKARVKFAKFLPTRRTIAWEDFAANSDGIEHGAAQGGPIIGARVMLSDPAAWSKKLSIRIRVRTAARTVQVGVLFAGRPTPWAAMAATGGNGWRDITVRASDFSAGPTGAASPADGDPIAGLGFSINSEEPGASGASLEIDDLAIILEE